MGNEASSSKNDPVPVSSTVTVDGLPVAQPTAAEVVYAQDAAYARLLSNEGVVCFVNVKE
jgi:hypothetical protein